MIFSFLILTFYFFVASISSLFNIVASHTCAVTNLLNDISVRDDIFLKNRFRIAFFGSFLAKQKRTNEIICLCWSPANNNLSFALNNNNNKLQTELHLH